MPPRIAFLLATSGHSGVDRVMGNLIPAIAARGYRVDLLRIRNHGPYLHPDPSVDSADRRGGLRIVELGAAHVYTALPAVIRYLRRERPAVLLSDKDRVNRVALAARRLARCPTRIAVRYGSSVTANLATRSAATRCGHYLSMRWAYPLADAILVPSRGAAQDLARFAHLPRERIAALPSPVVTPAFLAGAAEPPPHPWLDDPAVPVLLGVGELCARKDFETLLHAFARVRSERPCRLVILGEGKRRSRLEALASELGIRADLALPGFVPNPAAAMVRARVFVLGSRSEGSPVALIEALALGTPAVSTDCPSGPRETLRDGRWGRLVPVGDAPALARAILATLAAPPQKEVVRRAAQPFHLQPATDAYLHAIGLPPHPGPEPDPRP